MNFINPAPRPGPAGATPNAVLGPFTELSMYKEKPTGEISLEEFEEYALDRLRGAWAACSMDHKLMSSSMPGSRGLSVQRLQPCTVC